MVVRILRLLMLMDGPQKYSPESGNGSLGSKRFWSTTDFAASRSGTSRCQGRIRESSEGDCDALNEAVSAISCLAKPGTEMEAPAAKEVWIKLRRFIHHPLSVSNRVVAMSLFNSDDGARPRGACSVSAMLSTITSVRTRLAPRFSRRSQSQERSTRACQPRGAIPHSPACCLGSCL